MPVGGGVVFGQVGGVGDGDGGDCPGHFARWVDKLVKFRFLARTLDACIATVDRREEAREAETKQREEAFIDQLVEVDLFCKVLCSSRVRASDRQQACDDWLCCVGSYVSCWRLLCYAAIVIVDAQCLYGMRDSDYSSET